MMGDMQISRGSLSLILPCYKRTWVILDLPPPSLLILARRIMLRMMLHQKQVDG